MPKPWRRGSAWPACSSDICDIHALGYIYPKPMREAYERFVKAHGVAPRQAAMFDDLPHNLETAHLVGMTTVLVQGLTDHPEHQAIASWTELPCPYPSPHRRARAVPRDDAPRSRPAMRRGPSPAQFCFT